MLQFLNIFFFLFHTALTLFNMFGWAFHRTRKWNLLTLGLTAGSWFLLGIWFGWGYCLCTDWHYEVRERLGHHDQQGSYIGFLIEKISGVRFDPSLVEATTLAGFLISLAISLILNFRDWKNRKRSR